MWRSSGDSNLRQALWSPALYTAAAVILLQVASAGCADFAGDTVGPRECPDVDLDCTGCHGDSDTGNPAPPRDTRDGTDPTTVTVGAHAAHLGASTWRAEISCTECHRVPDRVNQTGHIDGGPAEVTWGDLARSDAATPGWDRTTETCSDTYCHGATLSGPITGGTVRVNPLWTSTDGSYDACGESCHTNPPGGTHPTATACDQCHGAVIASYDPVNPGATLWADSARHVNGVVDLGGFTCTSCHGDPATNDPSPPLGTLGETQPTQAAVGAHGQHLAGSTWHRDVQCTDCHVLPVSTTHANGVVDFSWGGPSAVDGANPVYDEIAVTCAGTYCHGSTLSGPNAGGTLRRIPEWTSVDSTYDACGQSCHTNPPGGSHPTSTACEQCHGAVIAGYDAANPASSTWTDRNRHVDGIVDLASLNCTSCHGDSATNNPAPPTGTLGESQPTEAAVGAHAEHLTSSAWHRDVQCNDCHVMPSSTQHANGTVDFSWAGPSNADGASSSYDSSTVTCAGTYCHGTTLLGPQAGGSVNRSPVWTTVNGSWDECGTTCHTNPPGGSHPANSNCEQCHDAVISSYNSATPSSSTWADSNLHINGVVEVGTLSCTSCHGHTPTNNPAPPTGTNGETSSSQAAVGAHTQHLGSSSWHREVQCTDCHTVPSSTQHSNGTVDFSWGGPSNADGASSSYDSATVTCAGSYCHGTTLLGPNAGGSVNRSPAWTTVDGTWDACGTTCHTNPPGGTHPTNSNCEQCHNAVISNYDSATPGNSTWADASRHVDGIVDVINLSCTSCHGDTPTNNPAPPLGTNGETQPSEAAVGAHTEHLGTSSWHRDVQCTDCHVVPSSTSHANGAVDFSWGGPSNADGASSSYDSAAITCAGTYCHGATLLGPNAGGTVNRSPVWTTVDDTWDECGTTCHTNPPGGSHPASTACDMCHGAVIANYDTVTPANSTWVDRTRHVDGVVDLASLTCTTCHGDTPTNNPAPPLGTSGETQPTEAAVGAHAQHLATSGWHRQVACDDCHVVPSSTGHTNGVVDFSWGGPSNADGASSSYDSVSVTCASTYCHGSTLLGPNAGGSVNRTPEWTTVDDTWDECGTTCHTNPPGGTHPANTNCDQCHGAVISSYNSTTPSASTWADASRHVDGVVDVASLTCTTCHGDTPTNNPAPPLGTSGETLTSQPAVGAHTQHLSGSTWHRDVQCTDCHAVPASTLHSNGAVDFSWGGPSNADGASSSYAAATVTCAGTYCHGATLLGPNAGGSVNRTPEWTTVNSTWNECGTTCHTNPPGASHPANTACETCHSAVISSYDSGNPANSTWADRTRHIDGVVDVDSLTCTSCHGDVPTNNPAPPTGTAGETLPSQAAVGAHTEHLSASGWHRQMVCTDCHQVPASTLHANGVTDFDWGGPSNADGASSSYDPNTTTCAGTYCHGNTLMGPNGGGSVNRSPNWTTVDSTWNECGTTCHTNPPGSTHPPSDACDQCHRSVLSSYDSATPASSTWATPGLHVNGNVEVGAYHEMSGWTTPGGGLNHHGSNYFLTNQQRDEHNRDCTDCHGPNLDGGWSGVSCDNVGCHGGDWRSCDFCHGVPGVQYNPPVGVGGETIDNTLAVGRHVPHLQGSSTHAVFACDTCHGIPAVGDVSHALQYVPSPDLDTAGHHGDVLFSAGATGMVFDVNATGGGPINRRGTCLGACHSDGRGGSPNVTPYWAGGTWNAGSCGNCHDADPDTGEHDKHVNGESIPCGACHNSPTSTTHMNGQRDANPQTAITPNDCGPGNIWPSCTGMCHGEWHSSECWN